MSMDDDDELKDEMINEITTSLDNRNFSIILGTSNYLAAARRIKSEIGGILSWPLTLSRR